MKIQNSNYFKNCSLIVKGVRFSKYGLLCSEGCGRADVICLEECKKL